jgi:hypothetical protein
MDSFKLIQNFFTRMACQHCQNNFQADDIELLREDHGIHVVSVSCRVCARQVGVAMVGVETRNPGEEDEDDSTQANPWLKRYSDPELTEQELERLASYAPITDDDVLDAHHFFNTLPTNWASLLPTTLASEDTSDTVDIDSEIDTPALAD